MSENDMKGSLSRRSFVGSTTAGIAGLASLRGQLIFGEEHEGGIDFSLRSGHFFRRASLELRSVDASPILFTLDGSDPDFNSRTYRQPLFLDRTTLVKARMKYRDGSLGPICGRHYIKVSEELQTFSSNLPIVVIDSYGIDVDEEVYDRPYRMIALSVLGMSSDGRASFSRKSGHPYHAAMHVRGNSSAGYPKKQYRIKTLHHNGSKEAASLLGLPADADWVLHAPFSDKTLMRNAFMYECSRAIGRYASRCRFVEVFYSTNGSEVTTADYRGVYVLMEKLKASPDRINVTPMSPSDNDPQSISGGYILRKDWYDYTDPNVFFESEVYEDALSYFYPKSRKISDPQKDWIQNYIGAFERTIVSSPPNRQYEDYIDVMSFIDHHLLVEMARNVDGFVLSTYLSKDRLGKIQMGPIWDYNGSLGNADYFEAWDPVGWHHENPEFPADNVNAYHWYERLMECPHFRGVYRARWDLLRRNELSNHSLMGRIDRMASVLREASERNFERWNILGEYIWPNDPDCGSRHTYEEEVEYLKDWLRERLAWMDQELA